MASRVIDVALKLRDAFTGPMKGAISSLTSFDKEGARVRKSVVRIYLNPGLQEIQWTSAAR